MPGKTNPSRNSAAVEDYLERILELINSKGYARVVDIAAALKISPQCGQVISVFVIRSML